MSAAGASQSRRGEGRAGGTSGEQRIATAFAQSGKQAALMPYLMGGYPDLERSLTIGEAAIAAGADLLELGIPFSDPLADGPVIHAAATAALAAGSTVTDVLTVAEQLATKVPVIIMVYANTVLTAGVERFVARLAAAQVSGIIVPDLPYEEGGELADAAGGLGLALIPLVAPTSTDERLAQIGARARGFVYVVSVTGTTGERGGESSAAGEGTAARDGAPSIASLLARAKASADVPVALGFGISTPEQAALAAAAGADGVIVGSRLVRAAGEAGDPASAVGELVARFSTALRRPVA